MFVIVQVIFNELNPSNGGWFTVNTTVTGTGSNTLTFISANDPAYTYLDDVSLNLVSGAVPEPASWAFMISGFGLVGVTMRRRNAAIA